MMKFDGKSKESESLLELRRKLSQSESFLSKNLDSIQVKVRKSWRKS